MGLIDEDIQAHLHLQSEHLADTLFQKAYIISQYS